MLLKLFCCLSSQNGLLLALSFRGDGALVGTPKSSAADLLPSDEIDSWLGRCLRGGGAGGADRAGAAAVGFGALSSAAGGLAKEALRFLLIIATASARLSMPPRECTLGPSGLACRFLLLSDMDDPGNDEAAAGPLDFASTASALASTSAALVGGLASFRRRKGDLANRGLFARASRMAEIMAVHYWHTPSNRTTGDMSAQHGRHVSRWAVGILHSRCVPPQA